MSTIFDQDHTKHAKLNDGEYYAIFKSLLATRHWLVADEETAKELTKILSMKQQISQWTKEFHEEKQLRSSDQISLQEFYLLLSNHDSTYMYSDCLSTWRAGQASEDFIKEVVKAHPEYLEHTTSGRFGLEPKEQVPTTSAFPLLSQCVYGKGDVLNRHLVEVSFNLPSKAELDIYIQQIEKLDEIRDHVRNWMNSKELPFYTNSTPNRVAVLATPKDFPGRLESIGDTITSLLMESNSHGLLRYFFGVKSMDYRTLSIQPKSRAVDETVIIIRYASVKFYHDTKIRLNKINDSKRLKKEKLKQAHFKRISKSA